MRCIRLFILESLFQFWYRITHLWYFSFVLLSINLEIFLVVISNSLCVYIVDFLNSFGIELVLEKFGIRLEDMFDALNLICVIGIFILGISFVYVIRLIICWIFHAYFALWPWMYGYIKLDHMNLWVLRVFVYDNLTEFCLSHLFSISFMLLILGMFISERRYWAWYVCNYSLIIHKDCICCLKCWFNGLLQYFLCQTQMKDSSPFLHLLLLVLVRPISPWILNFTVLTLVF